MCIIYIYIISLDTVLGDSTLNFDIQVHTGVVPSIKYVSRIVLGRDQRNFVINSCISQPIIYFSINGFNQYMLH